MTGIVLRKAKTRSPYSIASIFDLLITCISDLIVSSYLFNLIFLKLTTHFFN